MVVKRDPNALYCDEPSLTQQHFAEECDINSIVKRASEGALVTHVNARVGQYGDFSNIPDYQQAFAVVQRANALFMDMPWETREKFSNDPRRMVEFLQNPQNREEAVKLGLVKAPVVDEHLEALKSIDKGLRESSDSKSKKAHRPAGDEL